MNTLYGVLGALFAQADKAPLIVPDSVQKARFAETVRRLADFDFDEFLRNYADSLGIGRNVSRADLIKGLGMTEESFTAMMRPGAERQVQADLLLDAVVKAEDLHASDEDKEKFYKQLEEDYGENAEKVKGMIDEHLMMQDIERRKAADLIYESAVKTEPKAEEAAEAPAEAPAEEKKD